MVSFKYKLVGMALALAGSLVAEEADAHFQLNSPTRRYKDQESGPCGNDNDARTSNVATFEPGDTITVSWVEQVTHQTFRISFDPDGTDDFDNSANILVDNIPNTVFQFDVTLPNVECTNCTLQMIQRNGGSTYYQCADIVLQNANSGEPDAGPGVDPPLDAGVPDGDGDVEDDGDGAPNSEPEPSGGDAGPGAGDLPGISGSCSVAPGKSGAGFAMLAGLGFALALGRRKRRR